MSITSLYVTYDNTASIWCSKFEFEALTPKKQLDNKISSSLQNNNKVVSFTQTTDLNGRNKKNYLHV